MQEMHCGREVDYLYNGIFTYRWSLAVGALLVVVWQVMQKRSELAGMYRSAVM